VLLGTIRGAAEFHRSVAIKRVRSDLVDGQRAAALMEEAHLAAGLSHPNVVAVLDVDRDPAGQPFLVMEYVDGLDLEKLLETGPLPHSIASFIIRELLSGLGYIHESRDLGRGRVRRGLVHRDVSPENVLLSWEGEVKLTDLGVARMLESTMTAPMNAAVGKSGYMSPEQVNGQELDGRSDLYAAGIVLWELLAHRRLPIEPAGDLTANAVFRAMQRPSDYRQDVPADLEAVAMRLLAHNREERYRTAGLAAHDLMRCQDIPRDGRGDLVCLLDERFPCFRRQGPNSRPPGPPSEVHTLVEASKPRGAPPWPRLGDREDGQRQIDMLERAWRRRRRRVLAWGVLLALLMAATIAFLLER
jgi:serine/threonine-protein kinase